MDISRRSTDTMTPCVLNHGDCLRYTRHDGVTVVIELVDTWAQITKRAYPQGGHWVHGDISEYAFGASVRIDGELIAVERRVGSDASFYEPLAVAGLHLWLDAVRCIFDTRYDHHTSAGGFMVEKDLLGGLVCMPKSDARLVVQDQTRSICPEPMHHWYGDQPKRPTIAECYHGEDCWMGPYGGAYAHCGLDINMPAGSTLYAPIDLDRQYYFKRVSAGMGNNGWVGERQWADGSIWRLSTSHLIDDLVPEHQPLARGTAYATSAGTAVGLHQHTHFNLHVIDQGGSYMLDPWILIWQMLRDASGEMVRASSA